MGHELTNPHIHTQVWFSDKKAIQSIYDKVIARFELKKTRCSLTTPHHTNSDSNFYDYVIKDYSSKLSDNELWHLEETKKRVRKTLGLKLRFYSKSKSKYTQKAYRYFYRHFNILRDRADEWMDWFFSIFFRRDRVYKSSFIPIKNKRDVKSLIVLCFIYVIFYIAICVLIYSPSNSPPI